MPLKKRPLSRDDGVVKDANLIVIASEDKYAVQQYFRRFKAKRSQFHSLPTLDNRSSPQHVIDRLREFKSRTATEDGDSFWICIDRDRWPPHVLADVFTECQQLGYGFALSGPCFEMWILMHFEDAATTPFKSCREVSDRLKKVLEASLGGYSKQCCKSIPLTKDMVESAIVRAKLASAGQGLVPEVNHSQVYLILEQLRERHLVEIV